MNGREARESTPLRQRQQQVRIRKLTEILPLIREKLHLSQNALGELIGVSRTQILNYETGRRPMSWMAFLAILQVLKEYPEIRRLLTDEGIIEEGETIRQRLDDENLNHVQGGVRVNTGMERVDFRISYGGSVDGSVLREMVQNELRLRGVPENVVQTVPDMTLAAGNCGGESIGTLSILWHIGERAITWLNVAE